MKEHKKFINIFLDIAKFIFIFKSYIESKDIFVFKVFEFFFVFFLHDWNIIIIENINSAWFQRSFFIIVDVSFTSVIYSLRGSHKPPTSYLHHFFVDIFDIVEMRFIPCLTTSSHHRTKYYFKGLFVFVFQ